MLADKETILDSLLKNPKLLIIVAAVLWGIGAPLIRAIRESRARAMELARKRASGEIPTSPQLEDETPTLLPVEEMREEPEEVAQTNDPRLFRVPTAPEIPEWRKNEQPVAPSALDSGHNSRVSEVVEIDPVLGFQTAMTPAKAGAGSNDISYSSGEDDTEPEQPERRQFLDGPALRSALLRVPVRDAIVWSEVLGPPVAMRKR